jgi:hypothetical protein
MNTTLPLEGMIVRLLMEIVDVATDDAWSGSTANSRTASRNKSGTTWLPLKKQERNAEETRPGDFILPSRIPEYPIAPESFGLMSSRI